MYSLRPSIPFTMSNSKTIAVALCIFQAALNQHSLAQQQSHEFQLKNIYKIVSKLQPNESVGRFRQVTGSMLPPSKSKGIRKFVLVKSGLMNYSFADNNYPTIVSASHDCNFITKKLLVIGVIRNKPGLIFPLIEYAKILDSNQSDDWRFHAQLEAYGGLNLSDVGVLDWLAENGCTIKQTVWRKKVTAVEKTEQRLVSLEITGVSQAEIKAVAKMTSIEKLSLTGFFQDVTPISSLKYLTLFTLGSNRLNESANETLSGFDALTALNIQNTNLRPDFSKFKDDSELEEVWLPATGKRNLDETVLSDLAQFKIRKLVAANAGLQKNSIRRLLNIKSLETLDISGLNLNEKDYKLLFRLTKLRKLFVSGQMVAGHLSRSNENQRDVKVVGR